MSRELLETSQVDYEVDGIVAAWGAVRPDLDVTPMQVYGGSRSAISQGSMAWRSSVSKKNRSSR